MNYISGILLVLTQSSCFQHFYQTNTTHTVDAATLEKLDSAGKIFIVHEPNMVFTLKNVKINNEIISGDMDFSKMKYKDLLNPKLENGNKMSNAEKETCLSEVHLYTNDSFDGKSKMTLPINRIDQMDVYERDRAADTIDRDSKTTSMIRMGVIAGVAVVVGILIANALSNIPFSY